MILLLLVFIVCVDYRLRLTLFKKNFYSNNLLTSATYYQSEKRSIRNVSKDITNVTG